MLGLNVTVHGNVDQVVGFETGSKGHVDILWQHGRLEGGFANYAPVYPSQTLDEEPEVLLPDSDDNIELRTFHAENQNRQPIFAQERHSLLGWGTQYLYRALNTRVLVAEKDSIHSNCTTRHCTRNVFLWQAVSTKDTADGRQVRNSARVF